MQDPFFIAPIPWLADLIQPWCDRLDLTSLPLHIHEILIAAVCYSLIFWPISPILSRLLVPQHYLKLSRSARVNWDVRSVSTVQSAFISVASIWVMVVDQERRNMDWEERIWGYTGASAMIQALGAGYFIWDLVISLVYLDLFGFGALIHAAAALLVFILGFKPFANYYTCTFMLWEMSTPFLNAYWYMDKVNMTGSRVQLLCGSLVIFCFFSCRIIYGTTQSIYVFWDVWAAINAHPTKTYASSSVMEFATETSTVQPWLAAAFMLSNIALCTLNYYWFRLMMLSLRKRFNSDVRPATATEPNGTSIASGVSTGPKPQHRRA